MLYVIVAALLIFLLVVYFIAIFGKKNTTPSEREAKLLRKIDRLKNNGDRDSQYVTKDEFNHVMQFMLGYHIITTDEYVKIYNKASAFLKE